MAKTEKTLWVDFKLIKEKVTVAMALERYGVSLTIRPDGSRVGVCPLHEGADNPTAFTVSADGKAWKCFTRCQNPSGGNVLDLVMKKERVDLRRAGELLTEWFLLQSEPPQQSVMKKAPAQKEQPKVKPLNPPLTFELKLKKDLPFLLEHKGLTPATIEKFGLGYCPKGMHAGRVVVPIHNPQGELVGYAGRTLKKSEEEAGRKYHFPATFHKGVELYNLHRALRIPKLLARRGIVLVEGFFDAIKLWQNGVYNAVAIMGTSLSEWQEELLLTHTDKVTLLLDNNPAGREATEKIARQLAGKCFVKIPTYPPEREQPEHLTREELQEMLGLTENAERHPGQDGAAANS